MQKTIITLALTAVSAMGALASPPWQDQRVNSINREPMNAHILPFASQKAALDNRSLPASQRYSSLTGQRRVSLDGT